MSASQPSLKADAEVVAIQPEANKLTEFARSVVIKTAEQYQIASGYLKSIKGMLSRIDDAHARVKRPILAAGRELDAQKNEASAPLKSAELLIKRAMTDFSNEQDRIRREEQRKADEAARKQQEKLQQQAAKAIASGKVEKAVEFEQRAAAVVPAAIQREAPKVAGIVTKEVWKFEVTDPAAVPREYLSVDEKKIGGVVRSLKGDTNIAGVRVWSEKSIAAGAA